MSTAIPRYAQVWRLRNQGLTAAEIARELGITRGTVYAHLWQARRIYQWEAVLTSALELELERRAAVYPDEVRRDWIKEEMKRWRQKAKRISGSDEPTATKGPGMPLSSGTHRS